MKKSLIAIGITLTAIALIAIVLIREDSRGSALLSPTSAEMTVPNSILTPIPLQSPAPTPFDPFTSAERTKATGASAITGPVTEVSIQNYVAANPSGGGIVAKNAKVASVDFMSIKDLKSVLQATLGEPQPFLDDFPPDEQIAYVLLNGDFSYDTEPGSVNTAETTAVRHSAFRVFSVRTGNELMGGTLRN